jgi:hypothetical protein
MSLPTPRLDDRTYDQLREELIAKIPSLCPQWTDFNASDPGITIIELMSWMAELLLYRINRIPEKSFIRFLELLGTQLHPPTCAHTWVVFTSAGSPEEKDAPHIEYRTRLATASGNNGPVWFETIKHLNMTTAKLVKIIASGRDLRFPVSGSLLASGTVGEPILDRSDGMQCLYIGDSRLGDLRSGTVVRVGIELKRPTAGPLQVEWERWDRDSWVALIPTSDSTNGLRQNGDVCFIPDGTCAEMMLSEIASRWLRAILIGAIGVTDQQNLQTPLISKLTLAIERLPGQTEPPTRMYVSARPPKPKDIPSANGDRIPLVSVDPLSEFYPLGRVPQVGNAFYICSPLLSRERCTISIEMLMAEGYSPATNSLTTPEILNWEYFTRAGRWETLGISRPRGAVESKHGLQDQTDALTQEGNISFLRPDDFAPTEILGELQWAIRCRLSAGDYGGETGRPPIYRSCGVRFTDMPATVQHCVSENGSIMAVLSNELRGGETIAPFNLEQGRYPEISLGFDRSMGNREQSILFIFEEQDTATPLPLIWEYSSDNNAWRRLNVSRDDTHSLTRTGTLEFVAPADWREMTLNETFAFWIRSRLLIGTYTTYPPRLRMVHTNAVEAVQKRHFENEMLGSSNGEPGQVFNLRHLPVLMKPSILVGRQSESRRAPNAKIEWVPWESVDTFYYSKPLDQHSVIDLRLGTVTFGDNRRAIIPALGSRIMANYDAGGGIQGNVPAGTIVVVDANVSGISVINVTPASGGSEGETLEDAEMRGPWMAKHRDRAVTCEDYEYLAHEASPEVAKAFCFSEEAGGIHLLVIPKNAGNKPRPSGQLLRHLTAYLDARRIVTTRLRISGPTYEDIQLKVELTLAGPYVGFFDNIRIECQKRLQTLLDPLSGGSDGNGWPLGRALYTSEVYHLFTQMQQVDFVKSVALRKLGETKWGQIIRIGNRAYPACDLASAEIVQV